MPGEISPAFLASQFEKEEIMPNENCLAGMKCPKCHSEEPFDIRATTVFRVYDEGTDSEYGDVEWEPDSETICIECGNRGTISEFSLKGNFRKIANKFIGDLADFQKEIAVHSRDGEWDSLQTQLDLLEEAIQKARKRLPRVRCIAEEK